MAAMGGGGFDGRHGRGKAAGQIPGHMGVLASLSGKKKGDVAGGPRSGVKIDSLSAQILGFTGAHDIQGRPNARTHLGKRQGRIEDHDQAMVVVSSETRPQFPGGGVYPGRRHPILEQAIQFNKSLANAFDIHSGKGQDFDGSVPGDLRFFRPVFFEHDVKVAAAETKCADAAPAGSVIGWEPRSGGGIQIKRTGFDLQFGVGCCSLQCRWQDFVVQGQGRLDQSGSTGGRLGMADHGFNRSQRAAVAVGVDGAENAFQGRKFHFVADPRTGSVGFYQSYRFRVHAGIAVGFVERPGLSLGTGGVDALGLAVAGRADPADDGVDAIVVPLGIFQPFQHEDADALSENRSVSFGREGAGIASMREHTGFRKTHVHENVVDGVYAAGDHHFAFTGIEFQKGQVDGAHAAGAGGVHHAVGTAQVQAVADSAGHDIAKQTGKGVFLPGNVAVGDIGNDGIFLLVAEPFAFQGSAPEWMAQTRSQGDDEFLGSGDTQDHRGALAIEVAIVVVPGIGQRHFGGHQPQQLRCIRGFQGRWRNAELGRIERGFRQKTAAVAVDVIRTLGVAVKIGVQLIMRARRVGNTVDPVE